MRHISALLLASALLAAPVIAAQPVAKRPLCQSSKAPGRDARRSEPCRKPAIPPLVDQTPYFLASTAASPAVVSDVS